ncbi:MAG: hypothetical protein FWG81_05160 [Betaproteobacteria bacterium]|nr:hypothetical protein [Betaproteobacteria bacterium]
MKSVLSRQSGAILLLMLLFLALGVMAWFITVSPSPRRELAMAEKLAMAREALLGYAVLYPDARANRKGFVPGHLPCPDTDEALGYEGAEAGVCGSKGVSILGHFPWRSLSMPPLLGSDTECLWYLVSGNHKAEPKADLLNPDTAGLIEIVAADGQTVIAENVVAVLFAPGAPLPGQTRSFRAGADGSECRRDYDARQYLENAAPNPAAEGITRVMVGKNESVAWISREEWVAGVETRLSPEVFFADEDQADALMLTQRIAACIMAFSKANELQRLPWAAPLELTAAVPETFNFAKLADQKNRLAGRPPYSVFNSLQALGTKDVVIEPSFVTCMEKYASHSSCRLLVRGQCPDFEAVDGRPDSGSYNSHNGWWDKWKEHFFYLVAPNFSPAASEAEDCEAAPDGCLLVAGRPYAAAVIFAGEALKHQNRTGNGRMNAAQYLEGENAISIQHGGRTLSISGNDQISCIAAEADGLRLIANCGRDDCKSSVGLWLACQENGGEQCALPETFSGCACYGVMMRWQDEACAFASPRPLCRRLLARIKSCA